MLNTFPRFFPSVAADVQDWGSNNEAHLPRCLLINISGLSERRGAAAGSVGSTSGCHVCLAAFHL